MKRVLAIFLITFCLVAMHVLAHASGYGIFTQGARALGRADASIAELDSPSVIFFNPALLTQLEGPQGEIGTTLIFPNRSFTGATSADTEDDYYYPSTLYISHPLNEQTTIGVGFFNPFGLGTDWPDNWEGRYLATRSEIVTYDLRPVIARQITPALSVSAGIDYVFLDAELERMIDFTWAGSNPDGHLLFKGDGKDFGYNLGLAYRASDKIRLGLSYRSEVDIDIDASARFNVPAAFAGLFPVTTSAHTRITLPQQVFAGISVRALPELLIEASIRWEGWSAFKEMAITFDQPVAGQTSEIQPRNWDDTMAYSLGGEYRLNDATTLLGGYLYGESSVPDTTFEPAIPDSDTHLFCLGVAYQLGKVQLAAGYGYQLQKKRDKNNTIAPAPPSAASGANGSYRSDLHLLGVSANYSF